MVSPFTERDQERWARTQEFERFQRELFLRFSRPTKETIIRILVKAEQIAYRNKKDKLLASHKAHEYIAKTIWAPAHQDKPYHLITDEDGVNWNDVDEHIVNGGLFSDSDMEGKFLIVHKLAPEITILRAIMEDIQVPEEDIF
jgi:hypothetical protein